MIQLSPKLLSKFYLIMSSFLVIGLVGNISNQTRLWELYTLGAKVQTIAGICTSILWIGLFILLYITTSKAISQPSVQEVEELFKSIKKK